MKSSDKDINRHDLLQQDIVYALLLQRMAELQKRMEEKTARSASFGPFCEREYFDSNCDIFYEDLVSQHKQAEDELNKNLKANLKAHQPYANVNEKNHMG